jgi:hypothetical protein
MCQMGDGLSQQHSFRDLHTMLLLPRVFYICYPKGIAINTCGNLKKVSR